MLLIDLCLGDGCHCRLLGNMTLKSFDLVSAGASKALSLRYVAVAVSQAPSTSQPQSPLSVCTSSLLDSIGLLLGPLISCIAWTTLWRELDALVLAGGGGIVASASLGVSSSASSGVRAGMLLQEESSRRLHVDLCNKLLRPWLQCPLHRGNIGSPAGDGCSAVDSFIDSCIGMGQYLGKSLTELTQGTSQAAVVEGCFLLQLLHCTTSCVEGMQAAWEGLPLMAPAQPRDAEWRRRTAVMMHVSFSATENVILPCIALLCSGSGLLQSHGLSDLRAPVGEGMDVVVVGGCRVLNVNELFEVCLLLEACAGGLQLRAPGEVLLHVLGEAGQGHHEASVGSALVEAAARGLRQLSSACQKVLEFSVNVWSSAVGLRACNAVLRWASNLRLTLSLSSPHQNSTLTYFSFFAIVTCNGQSFTAPQCRAEPLPLGDTSVMLTPCLRLFSISRANLACKSPPTKRAERCCRRRPHTHLTINASASVASAARAMGGRGNCALVRPLLC